MGGLGDVARQGGLVAAALLARRARLRRDDAAYGRHVAAALRLAAPELAAALPEAGPGEIRLVEPIGHTRGGFFSALASAGRGADLFVKAVPSRGREARFWAAWARGEIRSRGAHYLLAPPLAECRGTLVTILAFARDDALPATRGQAFRRFRTGLDAVVRAVADFNSDHMGRDWPLPPAGFGRVCRVPRRRDVCRELGIEPQGADALVATMQATAARWGGVAAALDAAPGCLCHLDLGTGNVVATGESCAIIDFGMAAPAPAGADLHTILRYGGRGLGAAEGLVAEYVAVFAAKGIALDPEAVLRACRAHYATRYTNLRLRSVSRREVFEAAVAAGASLVEETERARRLHR